MGREQCHLQALKKALSDSKQEMLQNSLTTGQYLLTLLSFHLIQHVDAELKGHACRSEPVSAWTTLCTPKPQTASQKTRTAVRGVSATTAFLVTPGTKAQHPDSLHPSQLASSPCSLPCHAANSDTHNVFRHLQPWVLSVYLFTGFSVTKYCGHSILFEELVIALPLKAIGGKVFGANAAVLGRLEVFPLNSSFPLLAKVGSCKRKPASKRRFKLFWKAL